MQLIFQLKPIFKNNTLVVHDVPYKTAGNQQLTWAYLRVAQSENVLS